MNHLRGPTSPSGPPADQPGAGNGNGNAADDALAHFAAQVAHDFNNLLTGILGNLELMENRARRSGIDQFDSYMEGARHAAGRATGFARRLFVFSGRPAHDEVSVSPNRLLAELAELMEAQGTAVALALAPDAGALFCDAHQLELALGELLGNAAEASAGTGAGPVEIATARAGDGIAITIRDHGPGLSPEVAAQAGRPFFSTRGGGPGKGLGLAIVNRFAERCGGTLALQPAEGGGAVARLVLPRAG